MGFGLFSEVVYPAFPSNNFTDLQENEYINWVFRSHIQFDRKNYRRFYPSCLQMPRLCPSMNHSLHFGNICWMDSISSSLSRLVLPTSIISPFFPLTSPDDFLFRAGFLLIRRALHAFYGFVWATRALKWAFPVELGTSNLLDFLFCQYVFIEIIFVTPYSIAWGYLLFKSAIQSISGIYE